MNYEGKALTIAGSDSGGGAGIQADLKTFQSFDVFGMSVLTSITAQNTVSVRAVHDVPPEIVGKQIDAVMEDINADSVKTGMVSNAKIIEVIADKIKKYGIKRLVVDPVMVAKSGDRLLQKEAEDSLVKKLLPSTFILTPNVFEAEILSGIKIKNMEDARKAAGIIKAKGPAFVLLKGGHIPGSDEAVDILYDGKTFDNFRAERFDSKNTHGTGCTFSAAITACLSKSMNVHDAIEAAKDYITRAIRHAPGNIGKGNGPLYHNIDPLKPSAFEVAAEDFDVWFDKNRIIFESELLAEKHFLVNPGNAVSIGVGSGLFASKLGIKYGVEPAEQMAELARKRGIEVKIGYAEDVPYPDGKFDTVLLSTVLSYAKDPQKAVNEAYRILKPGGYIVVSFLTREGSYAMLYDLAYMRGEHDKAVSPEHPYPVKFIGGTHWHTTEEITAFLQKAGFKDLKYVQTLTTHPKYSNDELEHPVEGYQKGDYVVVQGKKP
ncbi:MAG: bifunctional hydroxymethylpyrimidine kinase/phosphomethylpyrimidine kinase [Candidatus Aminicenantes bacterium]|nr:bifunctional hydroxymethylpyrimidine kinase/phosphomethylpyrimidine kinase [Candidatus Aminicenantes bacterium]